MSVLMNGTYPTVEEQMKLEPARTVPRRPHPRMKVEINPEWKTAAWASAIVWKRGEKPEPTCVRYRTIKDAQENTNDIPMYLVDGVPTHLDKVPYRLRLIAK